MKKYLLTAILAVAALSLSAQRASDSGEFSFWNNNNDDLKIEWGPRVGLNVSTFNLSWDDGDDPKSKVGFNVGVAVNFPIVNSFYINSGLFYTTKGVKFEGSSWKENYNLGYIELPIYASYRMNFAEASQLQVNFGPYFAYGVNGKVKYEDQYRNEKVNSFTEDGGIKRFDCGLGLGVGYTFHKFNIGLSYQFGLVNILKDAEDGEKIKNGNFNISLGYNI